MTAYRVEMTRVVRASVDRVYRALTTPALMSAWVCPGTAVAGEIVCEPVSGGKYSIEMKLVDGTALTVGGKYIEIVPNQRLVYTWKWAHEEEVSQVTIALASVHAGTEITLLHEQLSSEATCDGHRIGWTACMEKLAVALDSEARV